MMYLLMIVVGRSKVVNMEKGQTELSHERFIYYTWQGVDRYSSLESFSDTIQVSLDNEFASSFSDE